MGMADANKRINLTAPLLSVRRHGGAVTAAAATGLPAAYKADATSSEPTSHTCGAVPFGWEHRPGQPKSVRTRRPTPPPTPPPQPPLTIVDVDEPSRTPTPAAVAVASERAARDEARRSDALSRDDDVSCVTVNCSATGLSVSDAAAGNGAWPGPCCDRRSGSVMMDRFLPAAHAVAAGSPQNAFRKAGSSVRPAAAVVLSARTAGGGDWSPSPAQRRLPFQHIAAYHLPPIFSPSGKNGGGDDDDDDANSDAHSTAAGFASKRCGLLSGSTRCVKSALLLSRGARRGAGGPFPSNGGGSLQREQKQKPLLPPPCFRNDGQHQLLQLTGDDHAMQSWEEVYIKSLLRSSGPGGLLGPAAAVATELDRTVRELYKRRDGRAVRPKASHLGLLLVLDRSNYVSPARKLSRTGDDTALLPKATTKKSSPNGGEKRLGRELDAAADAGGGVGGGYGFPLLLEDKEAVAGREVAALSPLPLPLPKSPTESWLSRALPSVSTRPPATSFLGLHVQPKKRASPLPSCTIDSSRDVHVHHDRQRQIGVHDLQK